MIQLEEFEESVERALLLLPDRIRAMMDNVTVCIDDNPSPEQLKNLGMKYNSALLGLYEGIPMNIWGRGQGNNLPDKITIFRIPIESMTTSPEDREELIRDVVWHEVAHHFGFDEKKVSQMEKKWRLRKKDFVIK